MTKKSKQKFKYLEKEIKCKVKQNAFFIIFKERSLKQIKTIVWKKRA